MGRRTKKGRDVDGMLLIDKPQGQTSNSVLQIVKRFFYAKKAGHTGSLDPLATGLLPICFGEATKFSQFLLDSDKQYWVRAKLGVTTNTGDADGEVVSQKSVPSLTAEKLEEFLQAFRGDIQQIPPMFSALKKNGVPLYKLARQGIVVEREARLAKIFKLELLSLEEDKFECHVHCSKGTYIRTLIEDIGNAIGCGAHVIGLRRTGVSGFNADQMVSMLTIEALVEEQNWDALNALLLPVENIVNAFPGVKLTELMATYIRKGQAVQVSSAPDNGFVRLIDNDNVFIGVGVIRDDGMVAPKRLLKA